MNYINCLTHLTDKEDKEEPFHLHITTSTSPRSKPAEEEGMALKSSAAEDKE